MLGLPRVGHSDFTWVAFFSLLCPGKYCKGGTDTDQHLFSLKDIQLFVVRQTYNAATASNAVLDHANFVSLLLTTHNNGVKGKLTGQECPAASMRCQVAYL